MGTVRGQVKRHEPSDRSPSMQLSPKLLPMPKIYRTDVLKQVEDARFKGSPRCITRDPERTSNLEQRDKEEYPRDRNEHWCAHIEEVV